MASDPINAILRRLTEEGLSQLSKKIIDPSTINVYKQHQRNIQTAMANVVATSNQLKGSDELSKQVTTLSQALQVEHQMQQTTLSAQQAILQLYQAENEAMAYLTNDVSKTEQVSVMVEGSEVGLPNSTYASITVPHKEILDKLSIDPSTGNIMLSRAAMLNEAVLQKASIESIDMSKFTDLIAVAIQGMWDELQRYAAIRGRMGKRRWRRYIELRAVFGLEARLTVNEQGGQKQEVRMLTLDDSRIANRIDVLYAYYGDAKSLSATVHRTSDRKDYTAATSGNRGTIFEAYKRWQQNGFKGSAQQALSESFSNTPWWAGGDVGDVQMKAMVGNVKQVQVATLASIVSLAQGIINILDKVIQAYSPNKSAVIKDILITNFRRTQTKQSSRYGTEVIEKVMVHTGLRDMLNKLGQK